MRSKGRNISGDAVSLEFLVGSPGLLPQSWLGEVGVPGVDGSCSLPPSQLLDSGMGITPYYRVPHRGGPQCPRALPFLSNWRRRGLGLDVQV